MSSEYAVWFAAHKKELSLGDISEEAFSVFEQLLGSEITATSAASQLITGRTVADEDKIRRQVFSLLVAVAQFFPETHPQLVELSKEIFSHPKVDRQPFGWGLRATHDGLEAQIKEILKSSSSTTKRPGPTSDDFSSLQNRWANFHAFNAKCCSAGTVNIGEQFIIPAAEQSLEATAPGPLQLQVYSMAVTAWLTYASPAILTLCRNNTLSTWREDDPKDKLWKGKQGFSEGRWEFWKTRLEELREQQQQQGGLGDVDGDVTVVVLLRQAFVAMEKTERAKKSGKK